MATDRLAAQIPTGPKGSNRFPKAERLRRQRDIQACLREGKRYRNKLGGGSHFPLVGKSQRKQRNETKLNGGFEKHTEPNDGQ